MKFALIVLFCNICFRYMFDCYVFRDFHMDPNIILLLSHPSIFSLNVFALYMQNQVFSVYFTYSLESKLNFKQKILYNIMWPHAVRSRYYEYVKNFSKT